MILHGDLPPSKEDITSIFERLYEGCDLVLGADSQDEGTNLFAFRSNLRPRFHFGPQSYAHKEWAHVEGLSASCLKSPGIGLDIDTLKDFMRIIAAGTQDCGQVYC